MDAATVALIIGVATLMVSRFFDYLNKIRRSKCFGVNIEMNTSRDHSPAEDKSKAAV